MNDDTAEFLNSAIFFAIDPDDAKCRFLNMTASDFQKPFIDAAEKFVSGFRSFLKKEGFDMPLLANLDYPFGSSIFWSLNGSGPGFEDETFDGFDSLPYYLEKYGRNKTRFAEVLERMSVVEDEHGNEQIHVSGDIEELFKIAEVTNDKG